MNTETLTLFTIPELVNLVLSFLDERLLFKVQRLSKLWRELSALVIVDRVYKWKINPSFDKYLNQSPSYDTLYERHFKGLKDEVGGNTELASRCLSILGPALFHSYRFSRPENRITLIHLTGDSYTEKEGIIAYMSKKCVSCDTFFAGDTVRRIDIRFGTKTESTNWLFHDMKSVSHRLDGINPLIEQLRGACNLMCSNDNRNYFSMPASLMILVLAGLHHVERGTIVDIFHELLTKGRFVSRDGEVFDLPPNCNLVCFITSEKGVAFNDDDGVNLAYLNTNRVHVPQKTYKFMLHTV